ncbi:cell division protein ZipA [Photobacterium sanguinicancri]|uniref:Cell division protein ZipA n=1 Tax=Photobacterium sanguinicancri TaxID=875932 RepID=A0AAW7YCE1_9GAMM|nr:cell division protein ZipA [Photobacterium sanguinicancri]MDO6544315.1 cell division protein ZipA [Photobacterium sanguinicancri]
MQELRLVLIIVGALMISALLLHGLWTSRKEKPTKFGDKPKPVGKLDGQTSVDDAGFDQDGVGAVRVKGAEAEDPAPYLKPEPVKTGSVNFGEKIEADPLLDSSPSTMNSHTDTVPNVGGPVPAQAISEFTEVAPQPTLTPQTVNSNVNVVAQQADTVVEQHVQTVPEVTLQAEVQPRAPQPQPVITQSPAPVTSKPNKEHEPGLGNLDMVTSSSEVKPQPVEERVVAPVAPSIDTLAAENAVAEPALDTNTVIVSETEIALQVEPSAPQNEPVQVAVSPEPVVEEVVEAIIEPEPEPEPVEPAPLERSYIALNIHARKGELLRGVKLFNSLEQNGLIFGENSVYHRHADKAGLEPVIFSVTNMVQPGNFPQQDIENFETPGIAFYLMLPCHGRADLNFNMMLQTVQQIADELSADVLDQDRNMITPYRITEYRDKAKFYTQV